MRIPVMIEHLPENGYRARAGDPFGFSVDAATRDEALQQLRELIDRKVKSEGTEIMHLEVPVAENPWLKMAGTLDPNDPMVQEWIQIMDENRRKADEDPDYL